jgi:replicative DNA helicase
MSLPTLIKTAPNYEEYERQKAEVWSAIVRFDTHDLPTFPTDIFPAWLRDFIEAEAEYTQTPTDLAGMLALSVLATCMQRWIAVEAKSGWIEPVNIYTVTALPPASRKSAVFRAFTAPLVAYEQQAALNAEQEIAELSARKDILDQQLDAAKREAAKAKPAEAQYAMEKVHQLTQEIALLVIPRRPRLIVDDVTPEALSTLLVEQGGRMAALSPEGDVFAIMAGRYSGTSGPNFGVFLKAHAGDTLRVDRRSRSEFVDWPALTLGITTQPDVVRGLAEKAGFRGQGLLGRFLYALPTSMVGRRKIDTPSVPEHIRTTYHERIATLLKWRELNSANSANSANDQSDTANSGKISLIDRNTNITILVISPSSNILLDQFLTWIEPHLGEQGAFGGFADWAGKLAGAALRIAGLLAVATQVGSHNSHNSQNEISEETLADALRLAHYLIAHARAAFAEMGTEPAMAGARRVVAWLEQRGLREFTKRELFEAIKGTYPKADDLDPILKVLCDHGYIRLQITEERGGPGRKPSPRYEAHPDLWSHVGSHNSHNSHNSQNGSIPAYSFELPRRTEQSTNGDVDVDYEAVRALLLKGNEADVRRQCAEIGINADVVIAHVRAVPGYRAVEGFE